MNTFEILAILFLRAASVYHAGAAIIFVVGYLSGGKLKLKSEGITFSNKGAADFAFIVLSFVSWFIKLHI